MDWMRLALHLAQQGKYSCPPNPMVGCVIIKNGSLIGRGFHKVTGGPHAEILALKQAGAASEGSDVYLTLEPCSHFGHTPPCVDALIEAKVRAVHIAIADPNPAVQGRSIEKLRRHGIAVHVGHCEEEAYQLNIPFFHYITHDHPYVIAKWAMTLDGKIALASGESKWITSDIARAHAHTVRAQTSGIMIGASTLRCDNPHLLIKPEFLCSKMTPAENAKASLRQPRPIVVTASGNLPLNSEVFKPGRNALIIGSDAIPKECLKDFDNHNIEYKLFPLVEGRFHLPEVMSWLKTQKISPLLVEGGSTLLTELFKFNCVNELYTYIAPKIMGGCHSLSPISGDNPASMDQLLNLYDQQMLVLGSDICMIGKTPQTSRSYSDFTARGIGNMLSQVNLQMNAKGRKRTHV